MNSFGGNSGAQINHVLRTKYDVYIFGASRASHHYDPIIIGNKLRLSCFNAGDDGKNATYQLGLLKLLLREHKPRLIIYEIGDITISLDAGTADLYPYYYVDSSIRNILQTRDKWARVKFIYPLYAYNRKIFAIFKGFLKSSAPFETGYRPLNGEMQSGEINRINELENVSTKKALIDPHAKISLREFASTCRQKGIEIVFSYSPSYIPQLPEGLDEYQRIAKEEGIPILLNGQNSIFSFNPKLFKDAGHLNKEGAEKFTQLFVDSLACFVGE